MNHMPKYFYSDYILDPLLAERASQTVALALSAGANIHMDMTFPTEDTARSFIELQGDLLDREVLEVIRSSGNYFTLAPKAGDEITINAYFGQKVFRNW